MADWIFQCNPQGYDLHAEVAESRDTWWTTPRYRSRIAVGDRVWMSIVGRVKPGLYYIATVTSPTFESDETEFGRWRTDIRYDYRVDPFLSRTELTGAPILEDCRALRGFRGSNQPISDVHAAQLWELAQGRLHELG
jgi:hypothetical protein